MQSADNDPDTAWQQMTPHLDEAMNQLAESDRQAILLRFFQRKPLKTVGEAMGISEDAARMRINRALDKLRGFLVKKGVSCSAVALAAVLVERSVQAAPGWIAQLVRTAAVEAAKAASVPSLLTTI